MAHRWILHPIALTFSLVVLFIGIVLILFYFPFISQGSENRSESPHSPQAVEEYQKRRRNCTTRGVEGYAKRSSRICRFPASSDHDAFGEGFRYSVLNGTVSFPVSSMNEKGDAISQVTGDRDLFDAGSFIEDVWNALDVPADYRLSLSQCDWKLYCQDDGSILLAANSSTSNCSYIVEQLL